MKRTIVAGLALALTLGAASVSSAQETERGKRDGRRPVAGMLKGIELTEQQKEQLKALREKQGPIAMDRSQFEKLRSEMKAARERSDTAALRTLRTQGHELMKQRRETMKQHREQMLGQVRNILTPAQREVFEKNIATAKERMKEHGRDGFRGGKRGHDGLRRGKDGAGHGGRES